MAKEENPLVTDRTEKQIVTDRAERQIIDALKLDEDMLKPFSIVVLFWSNLEHAIFVLINAILRLDWNLVTISLVESSFLQKLSIVSSLLHHSRNDELYYEWEDLKRRMETLRPQRNDLVHGLWDKDENSVQNVLRLKSKGRLSVAKKNIAKEEIRTLYTEISEVFSGVNALRRKIDKLPKSAFTDPVGLPIDRTQSPKSRAQAQGRAQKQAAKAPRRGSKLSPAQKRASRSVTHEQSDKEKDP